MAATAQQVYSNAKLTPMYAPQRALEQSINIVPNQTLALGTLMGELTATPGTFKPYASGNSDGSQIPKCALAYACTTDASGTVSLGTEWWFTALSVPAYFSGTFSSADLVGLDANAVTVMQAAYISGAGATGVIKF